MSRNADTRHPPRADAPQIRRPEGHDARLEALRLLHGVLEEGRMLGDLTEAASGLAPADRARAMTLATATLRRLGQADRAAAPFLRREPAGLPRLAIRLAAVEIHALGAPAHAAVDGAVAALRAAGAERGIGLVNAVARKVAGPEGEAAWAKAEGEAARINVSDWLWGRLSAAYGSAEARKICAAHLDTPPTDLTPHPKADAALLAQDLEAELLPTGSLRLARRPHVSALPGYDEGAFWVQDMAAALPAKILDVQPGETVLDLCAAPGGKTMQMAAAGASVTAVDISDRRLERLHENLARTGLEAEILCVDALAWDPEEKFDAILLDAPCSATGTVRRHPDLPHLKQAIDVKALIALQDALLDRAWGWLKPGGRIVFATCSLLPEEGEKRIEAFLQRTPDAARDPVAPEALGAAPEWVNAAGDLRLRPDFLLTKGGMDGFFAARLRKPS